MAADRLKPASVDINEITVVDFVPLTPENEEDVNTIIRWSTRESMVGISLGSIATHRFAKAAYISDESTGATRRLVGYGAITHIYSKSVLEVGGLVVAENVRGSGIASNLVRNTVHDALEAMNPELVLAFSNKRSASLFAKLGGVQIPDAQELPPEVWKVCHTCRFYDDALAGGDMCCGRVYDITGILEK